jgi:hypothetical protein
LYLLKINRISDSWLYLYFAMKKAALDKALKSGTIPGFCSHRETWGGRKCKDYCDVYEECRKRYEASLQPPGAAA